MMRIISAVAAAAYLYGAWRAAPVLWAYDPGTAILATSAATIMGLMYLIEALTGKQMGLTDNNL